MPAIRLRFYLRENRHYHHQMLYVWLLEEAQRLGIAGGLAFKAMAGYGHHGLSDALFVELAGELPVLVEIIAAPDTAEALLVAVAATGERVYYTRDTVEAGVLNGEAGA